MDWWNERAMRYVSVEEVNDVYSAQQRDKEELIRRLTGMNYLDRQLNPFKIGDSVRLKDSPYQGRITTLEAGSGVTFKSTLGPHISVTDDTLLERVIDPQVGDIYEDVNGNEWVIFEYGRKTGGPDPFLVAQLTGIRPPSYTHRSLILNTHGKTPSNLDRWVTTYSPKLRRRRGQ